MGHAERQADYHAEELGRLADIESWVEREWEGLRHTLAANLARGAAISINDRPVLDFDDVIERICTESSEGLRAALLLTMKRPELGGPGFILLIEREALALIDKSAQKFKDALEKEYE